MMFRKYLHYIVSFAFKIWIFQGKIKTEGNNGKQTTAEWVAKSRNMHLAKKFLEQSLKLYFFTEKQNKVKQDFSLCDKLLRKGTHCPLRKEIKS